MGYSLIAPLPDGNATTLSELHDLLKLRFGSGDDAFVLLSTKDSARGPHAVVKCAGWSMRIQIEDQPHVIEESRELAALYAGARAERASIALCHRRITVDTDDDVDMEHFNDFMIVLDAIRSCRPVALFDPINESFVN